MRCAWDSRSFLAFWSSARSDSVVVACCLICCSAASRSFWRLSVLSALTLSERADRTSNQTSQRPNRTKATPSPWSVQAAIDAWTVVSANQMLVAGISEATIPTRTTLTPRSPSPAKPASVPFRASSSQAILTRSSLSPLLVDSRAFLLRARNAAPLPSLSILETPGWAFQAIPKRQLALFRAIVTQRVPSDSKVGGLAPPSRARSGPSAASSPRGRTRSTRSGT